MLIQWRWVAGCRHSMPSYLALLGMSLAVLMGCAPEPSTLRITPTPPFATETLPATQLPRVTSTPGPANATSTPGTLVGTTTARLNVRAEPLSSSPPLGIIDASKSVQILGKDANGNWYQILYQGSAGIGWVASEYVKVENRHAVPVVGDRGSKPTGSVRVQVNIRTGPGTNYDTLGTLNPNDVVNLTGKDNLGAWLQIEFAASPGGRGWIAAPFLEVSALDSLPIVTRSGEVVGTSTPTGLPAIPTPSLIQAWNDGDSAEAPAFNVRFSPSGAGSIFYVGDVSAPQGDSADWIGFTPYHSTVTIRLDCTGNGHLTAELHQADQVVVEGRGLTCGATRRIPASPGRTYLLKLSVAAEGSGLSYVHYTASVCDELTP
jgi:uncharacterized protein YraI